MTQISHAEYCKYVPSFPHIEGDVYYLGFSDSPIKGVQTQGSIHQLWVTQKSDEPYTYRAEDCSGIALHVDPFDIVQLTNCTFEKVITTNKNAVCRIVGGKIGCVSGFREVVLV